MVGMSNRQGLLVVSHAEGNGASEKGGFAEIGILASQEQT